HRPSRFAWFVLVRRMRPARTWHLYWPVTGFRLHPPACPRPRTQPVRRRPARRPDRRRPTQWLGGSGACGRRSPRTERTPCTGGRSRRIVRLELRCLVLLVVAGTTVTHTEQQAGEGTVLC